MVWAIPLWPHFFVLQTDILSIVQTLRTNELKVWTVLSTEDIIIIIYKISYLVQ